MKVYVVRRLLLVIPTIFIASFVIFFLVHLIPGNVVDMMVSGQQTATEEARHTVEHDLGLDVPLYVQYVRWIGNISHGDLGKSLWTKTAVTQEIVARLPVTLELGIIALLVSLLIALPIGIYSAIRQDTLGDYLARTFAILCIAVPGFWLGTLVIVFPAIWWGYTPPIVLIPFADNPLGNLRMFILPGIILGMQLSGQTMRMTRTMMLEVLRQDYIRTAWAKGLKERVVIVRHALKNALIPVVTLIGILMPTLIGGTVIIEQIFGLPGLGRLIVDSTFRRDYTLISGVMLFYAFVLMFVNLVVDVTYGFLDPRTRNRYR